MSLFSLVFVLRSAYNGDVLDGHLLFLDRQRGRQQVNLIIQFSTGFDPSQNGVVIMPRISYTAESRELRIKLPDRESEVYFADLGSLLTQFLDRKLRALGIGITTAMGDGNGKPMNGGRRDAAVLQPKQRN